MANKSKMACNRPVPSDRPGKKKMVKACAGGKEKLYQHILKLVKEACGKKSSTEINRGGSSEYGTT